MKRAKSQRTEQNGLFFAERQGTLQQQVKDQLLTDGGKQAGKHDDLPQRHRGKQRIQPVVGRAAAQQADQRIDAVSGQRARIQQGDGNAGGTGQPGRAHPPMRRPYARNALQQGAVNGKSHAVQGQKGEKPGHRCRDGRGLRRKKAVPHGPQQLRGIVEKHQRAQRAADTPSAAAGGAGGLQHGKFTIHGHFPHSFRWPPAIEYVIINQPHVWQKARHW